MMAAVRAPASLERDSLLADLEAAQRLLSEISKDDPLSQVALNSHIGEIQSELSQIARAPTTVANAAVLFSGDPVDGSRSIQAEFAAKMILKIQDIVSKIAAANVTSLASRGPVPGVQDTKLKLTGLAFGSFGFVFEEQSASSPEFFDSPMKLALERTFDIVSDFARGDEGQFQRTMKELEPRVFFTLREFVSELYVNNARFRVVEDSKTLAFDSEQIALAHQRLQRAEIVEDEFSIEGMLIGLIPIGRRFEFAAAEGGEIISGSVGPRLSQDFLERIEREQFIGKRAIAKLSRKTVSNVGSEPVVTYVLADLAFPP